MTDRRQLHGWHQLPDGRDGLYVGGVCCASIAHHPEREPPWVTDSYNAKTWRSLRNLDTRAEAMAHCERWTGFGPDRNARRPLET